MNDVKERSRRMQSLVLKAIGRASGTALATEIGASESKVSRLKNEHLEDMCNLLAAAGLRIVPADVVVVNRQLLEAIFVLAKSRLSEIDSAADLVIPDEEWTPSTSSDRSSGGSG